MIEIDYTTTETIKTCNEYIMKNIHQLHNQSKFCQLDEAVASARLYGSNVDSMGSGIDAPMVNTIREILESEPTSLGVEYLEDVYFKLFSIELPTEYRDQLLQWVVFRLAYIEEHGSSVETACVLTVAFPKGDAEMELLSRIVFIKSLQHMLDLGKFSPSISEYLLLYKPEYKNIVRKSSGLIVKPVEMLLRIFAYYVKSIQRYIKCNELSMPLTIYSVRERRQLDRMLRPVLRKFPVSVTATYHVRGGGDIELISGSTDLPDHLNVYPIGNYKLYVDGRLGCVHEGGYAIQAPNLDNIGIYWCNTKRQGKRRVKD